MPYFERPFPYSSMFCSRCPTWNSIYIRSWAENIYGVENILLRLEHIEFKTNVVICALIRMPYSVWQYVLLGMPRMRLFGVRHSE